MYLVPSCQDHRYDLFTKHLGRRVVSVPDIGSLPVGPRFDSC